MLLFSEEDWNSSVIVNKLYTLFLSNAVMKKKVLKSFCYLFVFILPSGLYILFFNGNKIVNDCGIISMNFPYFWNDFLTFQSNCRIPIQTSPSPPKPAEKRTPASIQQRLKIFPYLLKSREAANEFPACIQVADCRHKSFGCISSSEGCDGLPMTICFTVSKLSGGTSCHIND